MNSENAKTSFSPRNQINEKEKLKIKEENWEKMQEDVEKNTSQILNSERLRPFSRNSI